MEEDLINKIRITVASKGDLKEAEVRSLMILIRKILDNKTQSDQEHFLTLRLYCNWVVHNNITNSNTGLRILANINDALVRGKHCSIDEIQGNISSAIGYPALRKELRSFFIQIGVEDTLISDKYVWTIFITYLIEIIRDVPLSFPHLSKLDETKQKIYNHIARNPIKPGAGVVSIKISLINYEALGAKGIGEIMCMLITTEDSATVVMPLLIDVRL